MPVKEKDRGEQNLPTDNGTDSAASSYNPSERVVMVQFKWNFKLKSSLCALERQRKGQKKKETSYRRGTRPAYFKLLYLDLMMCTTWNKASTTKYIVFVTAGTSLHVMQTTNTEKDSNLNSRIATHCNKLRF